MYVFMVILTQYEETIYKKLMSKFLFFLSVYALTQGGKNGKTSETKLF